MLPTPKSAIPTVRSSSSIAGHRRAGRVVAGRRRCAGAEVFPPRRRAGAPAAKVAEHDVPEWLWRSMPDETALAALPQDRALRRRDAARARSSTAWPAPGPTGAGRAATSTAKTMPAPSTTSIASCWRRRSARPTRRNGSTPACTGPTASTGRARATGYVDHRDGEARPSVVRLRASAAACLLHPERRRRPGERRRHHGPVGARGAPLQVRLGHRLQLLAPARRGRAAVGRRQVVRA